MYETDRFVIDGESADEIARQVEEAIRNGSLDRGDQLPPIRELAQQLEVSASTVGAAYRTLRQRGMVTTHRRRGTRVSLGPPLPARGPVPIPNDVRDLAHGNPNRELLPPIEMVLDDFDPRSYLYGEQPYRDPLLELAAERFEAAGIVADEITIVNGAMDAHERVLQVHLRPGDRIAIEDPGLPNLIDLVAAMGFQAVPVPVDDRGMEPNHLQRILEGDVRAVSITPRAQNPTGAALDAKRAAELTSVLEKNPGTLVIENDHAGEVAGSDPVTVTRSGMGRWAVIHSVSKTLGPDLRLATIAGDPTTIGRVEGRMLLGTAWTSNILQQLVVAMWSHPETPSLLEAARDAYAKRRRALVEALGDRGIEAHGASGLNVWIEVEDEATVMSTMLKAGWGVSPGSRFRLESGPGLRATITTLAPEAVDQLADDLVDTLRPSRRIYGV